MFTDTISFPFIYALFGALDCHTNDEDRREILKVPGTLQSLVIVKHDFTYRISNNDAARSKTS